MLDLLTWHIFCDGTLCLVCFSIQFISSICDYIFLISSCFKSFFYSLQGIVLNTFRNTNLLYYFVFRFVNSFLPNEFWVFRFTSWINVLILFLNSLRRKEVSEVVNCKSIFFGLYDVATVCLCIYQVPVVVVLCTRMAVKEEFGN